MYRFSTAEWEFEVQEDEDEHIGDLFLTKTGYGIEKARWDLAVKISHINKTLALACSDDKKIKVVRKKGGDRKMLYWPYEREIVFHLFGEGFNTSMLKSRKCYTVDIQEILSNFTERWLYSTHVLEAYNHILKVQEKKSNLLLTPGKATLERLGKDDVKKFQTQSGWDFHVKLSTPSDFVILAFPTLMQLEIFEKSFKRII